MDKKRYFDENLKINFEIIYNIITNGIYHKSNYPNYCNICFNKNIYEFMIDKNKNNICLNCIQNYMNCIDEKNLINHMRSKINNK
jgi:hypothetical protein